MHILKAYSIHCTLRQNANVHSDKINSTKDALFFSWAPLHKSFNLNSPFSYELKRKLRLSKSVCRVFDPVWFMLMFIFLFNKKHGPLDFRNSYNFLQNQNNRKLTRTFALRPLIFRLQQAALKFNDIWGGRTFC